MTDYGRGSGSEPWHPEDPLFGDVYEQGGPAAQGGYVQNPQQGGWQDPYADGRQQYPAQGYPQQQYPQQQPQYPQQPQQQDYQAQYQQQPYPQGGGYDPYDTGSYQTGGYAHQDPYGGAQAYDPYAGAQRPDFYGQNGYPPPQQPQFRGGPQQGMQQQGMPGMQQQGVQGGPGMGGPMGHPEMGGMQGGPGMGRPGMGNADMGGPGMDGPGMTHGHGMGEPGMDDAAMGGAPGGPQPGPRSGHPQEPGVRRLRTAPGDAGEAGEWGDDDEADLRDHAFFSGHDDDDDDLDAPSDGGRRAARGSGKTGRKRRSGCACLVVALVLAGGVGGAGYFGYTFYESHFGPAPDYSGSGAGDVQVEIPVGSTLNAMGNILKSAGVVKSVDAFSTAADKNPKGRTIQPGVYLLHRQMSAAAAVAMMLDPASQSAMIVPEGKRASAVYQEIDAKLGLKAGTTAAQVKSADLGLPSWAKGNAEGFLFPAKYSAAKGMKPVDVVKQMVARANAQFTRDGLVDGAQKAGKTPLQILTIASLIQAEAQEDQDFGKVSRVVYNRLDQNMALGFDSTINYAMGRSTLNTSVKDTHVKSPYNTYDNKGLPPGPIDNPGDQAITAAMNPTPGTWLYFVTVKPGDTRFATTDAEHQKNVADFNKYQKEHGA